MIIIFFEYVNEGSITHLFDTVWEVTGEHFEKALQAYLRQQRNKYLYLKLTTAASQPDKWRSWTALYVTRKA